MLGEPLRLLGQGKELYYVHTKGRICISICAVVSCAPQSHKDKADGPPGAHLLGCVSGKE